MLKVMGQAFFIFLQLSNVLFFFRIMQISPYPKKSAWSCSTDFHLWLEHIQNVSGLTFSFFCNLDMSLFCKKFAFLTVLPKKMCTLFVSHKHFYESDQYSCKKNQSPLCPSSSAIRLSRFFFYFFIFFFIFDQG